MSHISLPRFFLSFVVLLVARLVVLLKVSQEQEIIIGSNYGLRPDPNAVFMVNYYLKKDTKVWTVGALGKQFPETALTRGSLKSALTFLNVGIGMYTHSASDLVPGAHKLSWLKRIFGFPRLIFLQHGVIGLKNNLANGKTISSYINSIEPTFDKMVVSSKNEENLIKKIGVPSDKIEVTGLPRFDGLSQQKSKTEITRVVIFFTWQHSEILLSKLKEVSSAIDSSVLDKSKYSFHYCLHDMQLAEDNIFIQDIGGLYMDSNNLSTLINCCDLLITDDSSTAWDVFYRSKEVIFYKGATDWLRRDSFLLERRANTETDLIIKLGKFHKNQKLGKSVEFTKYNDKNHCKRVAALANE